jgi:hypothetical protein
VRRRLHGRALHELSAEERRLDLRYVLIVLADARQVDSRKEKRAARRMSA